MSASSHGANKAGLEGLYTTFVQNVSHELRTPLTLILGYAEMLRDENLGALTPEQRDAAFYIADGASELRVLVERIGVLMAAKARMGTTVALALTELATEVMEKRDADATQAGLSLEMSAEPDLPLVLGDRGHLHQAVDCLVENAIKFTPAGGRVEVHLYAEPGWVCLAVSDNGIGLPEQDIADILSPFQQADGSSTRQQGGIGLGLTVTQEVIQEHSGQIDVQSQPGQGSRFTVKLPVPSRDTPRGQPERGNKGPRRILVVDDDERVAIALRDVLEGLPNCEIAVATGGQEALRHLKRQPFDLLITDYKMPDIDGLTLARRIRQLCPWTAVILITAYRGDAVRGQSDRTVFQHILDKPAGLGAIRSAVQDALGETDKSCQKRED